MKNDTTLFKKTKPFITVRKYTKKYKTKNSLSKFKFNAEHTSK